MTRGHKVDGFQLISGVLAVIAGLVMFALGEPVGWSALILVDGIAVLAALCLINRRDGLERSPVEPGAPCTRGTRQRARRDHDASPRVSRHGTPRAPSSSTSRSSVGR